MIYSSLILKFDGRHRLTSTTEIGLKYDTQKKQLFLCANNEQFSVSVDDVNLSPDVTNFITICTKKSEAYQTSVSDMKEALLESNLDGDENLNALLNKDNDIFDVISEHLIATIEACAQSKLDALASYIQCLFSKHVSKKQDYDPHEGSMTVSDIGEVLDQVTSLPWFTFESERTLKNFLSSLKYAIFFSKT